MTMNDAPRVPKDRIHLLLVEDDRQGARYNEQVLREQPAVASLTTVGDAEAALELLRARKLPQKRLVVLIDLEQPRMSGLELLRRVRSAPELCALPVVVMAPSLNETERADAYALHAAGYYVKSSDPGAIEQYLASMCAYWGSVAFPEG
jgi:CheY-like chemotaxis protein